ncbi:MAG TPA: MerR family DNA-binding protein [Microbacteriaceae bacterium]|nr:MerR family DNA-binding protein [Microbacteriaceae bacterium]
MRFLRAIKEAQAVGFTLTEIADYLRAARRSAAPSETLRVRMVAKIGEIDDRIAALRRMREQLARVVGYACSSLDHCTCGAADLARRGKEPAVRPTLLHITNGESAGNTLRQTALGGAVLPWQDPLHAGPVPALARKTLLRTRAGFLADCGWGRQQAILSSLERRDQQLLEALRDDARVVLWFEHDLYDQLQLLDVLTLAHTAGSAPELIVIGSFPGKPSFAGLGELTARELETLWPSRRPAGPAALETAAAASAAFQAPEPTQLVEWATQETTHLPFLAPALQRLLEEPPAPTNGLSRTERHALEAIDAGARTPPAAFVAAQRLEDAPFLGDTWFYRSLSALGQGTNRLLETDAGTPLPPPPPLSDNQLFARLQLRLTPTGERTLRGTADRVELLGIDRWIGGTHLTPNNIWRWHPTNHKLLPPPRH